MNKILQYELWQECNNKCKYCTLGENIKCTPKEMKLEAINTAIQELQILKQGEVSTLGFIGGEFFQGQLQDKDVKRAFLDLIDLSNQLLNEGIIKDFWLNATLTIGPQTDLFETLEKIDMKEKVWLLTSYDTIGRFHTKEMLNKWENHMGMLKLLYPEIRRNTTMIITGDFIQKYIKDEIDLCAFSQKYDTSIFLKTPVKPDTMCDMTNAEINHEFGYYFFPKQIDFMKFLFKYKEKEGSEAYERLFSNELKAGELHKNFNDKDLRNVTFNRSNDYVEQLDCDKELKFIETMPCGHSIIYNCYVDQEGCAICDKTRIGLM
jgi:hypothetical protein